MREMKNSGIEWMGDIPQTWGTIKFKYLHSGLNTGEAIDKEFWSTDENDRIFYTAGLVPIRTTYTDFPEWKLTKNNDLLLARNGTPYVYYPESNSSYTDHIIRAMMKDGVNRRFIQYSLQQSISSVVVETVSIATWSASLWNEQIIAYPTLEEQKRIADYLDCKCAEIDAVIEKTKATIEEYKKIKQQIIIEAITKGIDKHCEMKESGIDWIGKVPIETEIIKIKYVTDISRGLFNHRPRNDERYYGGKYPFIQTGDVARAGKFITTYSQTLNELGISVSKLFPKGTMTMTIAANIGDVAILGFDAYFPDSVVGFTPKQGYFENYIYYLFCSMKEMFMRTAVVSTQLNLNIERIKELFAPIIKDIDKQKEIADYLDEKCAEIDTLIAKKTTLLEEMENYKKSVIYEYVTGKKEVM